MFFSFFHFIFLFKFNNDYRKWDQGRLQRWLHDVWWIWQRSPIRVLLSQPSLLLLSEPYSKTIISIIIIQGKWLLILSRFYFLFFYFSKVIFCSLVLGESVSQTTVAFLDVLLCSHILPFTSSLYRALSISLALSPSIILLFLIKSTHVQKCDN